MLFFTLVYVASVFFLCKLGAKKCEKRGVLTFHNSPIGAKYVKIIGLIFNDLDEMLHLADVSNYFTCIFVKL